MRDRQHHNPLEELTRIASGAGDPESEAAMEQTREHMERLVAAADDAYARLQADRPEDFLRQVTQMGGQ